MFAVLKTGGKQYKVQSGDLLRVEKLAADAGEKVQFNDILMLGGDETVLGMPFIDDAAVQAEVVDQVKGDKVIHFVKRRRKHSSKRTKGHRQQLTLLRITDILSSGAADTGIKVALGAGSVPGWTGGGSDAYALNATDQAEMSRRVQSADEASEKSVGDAAESTAAADGARPANLMTEARDGNPDNLKKMSGVGPKLEGLLHENGVFHFDQIAAWTEDEVAYMDEKLSFKGRIARDNWIEQATKLAEDKE